MIDAVFAGQGDAEGRADQQVGQDDPDDRDEVSPQIRGDGEQCQQHDGAVHRRHQRPEGDDPEQEEDREAERGAQAKELEPGQADGYDHRADDQDQAHQAHQQQDHTEQGHNHGQDRHSKGSVRSTGGYGRRHGSLDR